MVDLISKELAMRALASSNGDFLLAMDKLENIPAVDAVPVVHGRWIKIHGYYTPGGDPVWRCSICSKGIHVYGIENRTYGSDISDGQWVACPNCGAKMDAEETNR